MMEKTTYLGAPRMVRWAGNVACMAEMRNSYKIFIRKTEGKKPLDRPS
jgi:hypothetical protein